MLGRACSDRDGAKIVGFSAETSTLKKKSPCALQRRTFYGTRRLLLVHDQASSTKLSSMVPKPEPR